MTKSRIDKKVLETSSDSASLPIIEDPSIATTNLDRIARNLGFASYKEYLHSFRARIGAASESEYQKLLAQKKGLITPSQYQKQLKLVRAQNPEYRKLARLIKLQLTMLDMTQSDLARRSGLDRQLISDYSRGFSYPKPKKLRRILRALQVLHYQPIVGRTHHFGLNRHMQKPRHQKYTELSNSLNWFFKSYSKDPQWLARQTGIPLQHILLYVQGLIYPKADRLERIIQVCDSLNTKKTNLRHKSKAGRQPHI